MGIVSCWIIGLPLAIIFAFSLHLGAIGLRLGIMIGILYGCIQLINRLIKANRTDFFPVSYKAKFRENLNAKDSELLNPIEILSDKSIFNNCKTKNLIIKELPRKKIIQQVKLVNNTEIAGDIIFNSGRSYCD